jgi:hypothetical protein
VRRFFIENIVIVHYPISYFLRTNRSWGMPTNDTSGAVIVNPRKELKYGSPQGHLKCKCDPGERGGGGACPSGRAEFAME